MIREPTPAELFDFAQVFGDGSARLLDQENIQAVEVDGEMIALFGMGVTSPGVGQVWVQLADGDQSRHAITLVRAARTLAAEYMNRLGLHRIQTTVPADDYMLGKWLGLCGFTAESVIEMGGPNREDLVVFRILRGH